MVSILRVVSFPKSGRTWLRVMLDDLSIEAVYTHDGSGYEDHASIATLNADKTKYAAGSILLMVRDPRDIVVSGYFQARRRLRLGSADSLSMSDFIRDERYGIEKVVRFNLQWFAAAPQISRFAIVQYEDLHKNTGRTLSAVARFAGSEKPAEAMADVVSQRSLAHMRRLEASGALEQQYGSALMPADPSDPESYKVRRGIIGGYVDYLSGRDVEYCDRILGNAGYFPQLREALAARSVLRFGEAPFPAPNFA